MNFVPTELPGVLVVEPRVFGDDRGHFFETYHAEKFAQAGITLPFVQDNASRSVRHTLRGLHFQEPTAQGKLVRATAGAIWDVAVDIRRGSPTFRRWVAVELSAENRRALWVPPGFAHGFLVLSDGADVSYKCTALYTPAHDRGVAWDDPSLAIPWPLPPGTRPLLSPKDAAASRLDDAPVLPAWTASPSAR